MTRKNLKDSKYRKESKEEKKLRLQAAQKSREQCAKIAPYAIAIVVLLCIIFSVYISTRLPPVSVGKPEVSYTLKESDSNVKVVETADTTTTEGTTEETDPNAQAMFENIKESFSAGNPDATYTMKEVKGNVRVIEKADAREGNTEELSPEEEQARLKALYEKIKGNKQQQQQQQQEVHEDEDNEKEEIEHDGDAEQQGGEEL